MNGMQFISNAALSLGQWMWENPFSSLIAVQSNLYALAEVCSCSGTEFTENPFQYLGEKVGLYPVDTCGPFCETVQKIQQSVSVAAALTAFGIWLYQTMPGIVPLPEAQTEELIIEDEERVVQLRDVVARNGAQIEDPEQKREERPHLGKWQQAVLEFRSGEGVDPPDRYN